MKKHLAVFAAIAAMCLTSPMLKAAGETGSGTLTVSATVDPSISLTFSTDASGVTLGAEGASATTLAFGTIKAYGYTPPANVTSGLVGSGASATDFYVQTPFDVLVMKANLTSTDYTLTAQLGAADAAHTWKIDTLTVLDTATTTITATGSYGSAVSHTLKLLVPFSSAAGAVSKAIDFVATAN